jgi:spermidine/putrescine transport system permease protein
VTAPAISTPVARGESRRPAAKVDRWAGVVEVWLRAHAFLAYAFLYLPIFVVVLFAFNGTERAINNWDGFSLRWFEVALNDRVVQRAVTNSFLVAIPNAILATIFGTMAALGLQRTPKGIRLGFVGLTYISVIVPEVVIALATLILFATGFDALDSLLGLRLNFGHPTIIAAHILFNMSLVLLLVQARLSGMDRTLTEASADLFATPWRTFRQITFPMLLPAIFAGFLLAFTFSFDDFVITSFVSGPGSTTLPLFVFGQVKRGVTPETNAIATIMLVFTLGMLLIGQLALARSARRRGLQGSMASIVVEER